MQRQALGQLFGTGRTPELGQQAEQSCAGRLGKCFVGPRRGVHCAESFAQPELENSVAV
jgi:hypothetical protein